MAALTYPVQESPILTQEDLEVQATKELTLSDNPLINPFYIDLDAAIFLYTD